MPLLTVRHVTTYRYKQAVAFGEHRVMFRPRDSYDQRLLSAELSVTPEPISQHWMHDVFGNCVAIVRFARRATELRFESTIRLDHDPANALTFPIAPQAEWYPFSYDAADMPDLLRSIERAHRDTEGELARWARGFVRSDRPAGTLDFLSAMTNAVRRDFTYVAREEMGIQEPLRTLKLGSGSCRDFAILMIEAVRALGLAARFVSGYLYVPSRDGGSHVGGGATHAWVQVYLPGAGWMEFDPTNGIVGNRDLIRVAVARDPAQAVPLSGTYIGFPSDSLGMTVEVDVTAEPSSVAGVVSALSESVARRFEESRPVKIRAGYELAYESPQPTPMLLVISVHPDRAADLRTPGTITYDPFVPAKTYQDGFGNICTRILAPQGRVTIRTEFLVEDSGLPDPVAPDAHQHPVEDLPDDVLVFLLGSRYCETDRLSDTAWSLFGATPPGWARVQAICDFVHDRISFGYEHARATRTAWEGFRERVGVCRDFAHLAVALCRCMNIPARYCTGYLGDIGVPPADLPMDFSGWFEAYLGGRWYTFDARHNTPRIGRILMARGRDATDVAISTSFGAAKLVGFQVVTDEVAE